MLALPLELVDQIFAHLADAGALTSDRLRFFAGTRLSEVCVSACDIDDLWTQELLQTVAAGSLERVAFTKCQRIGDLSLAGLAGCPRLTSLTLDYCVHISDAGLAHLSGLRQLKCP